tara:strand:+ start:63156 stop:64064 length:909 start_codon:yes stop_codon:yes gene_type:complete
MHIKIGTRGSDLAIKQSSSVAKRLSSMGHKTELVKIDTVGDLSNNLNFNEIGPIGIFIKEIEKALIEGKVDIAVHSCKDLPAKSLEGLTIAAISERIDPADIIIANKDYIDTSLGFIPLKENSVIGTSSVRRKSWLEYFRDDIKIKPIRGNVPTRIKKIHKGYDAVVLANAGIQRLLDNKINLNLEGLEIIRLDPEIFIPAPSQGAIAIQCQKRNINIKKIIESINDADARRDVDLERLLLAQFEGGCNLPFGAYCFPDRDNNQYIKLVSRIELNGKIIESRVRGKDRKELFKKTMSILIKK